MRAEQLVAGLERLRFHALNISNLGGQRRSGAVTTPYRVTVRVVNAESPEAFGDFSEGDRSG